MRTFKKLASAVMLIMSLFFLTPSNSSAITRAQKPKGRSSHTRPPALTRAEMKEGEARLAEALEVPVAQARRWLEGGEHPPTEIYHKVLDLLISTGEH